MTGIGGARILLSDSKTTLCALAALLQILEQADSDTRRQLRLTPGAVVRAGNHVLWKQPWLSTDDALELISTLVSRWIPRIVIEDHDFAQVITLPSTLPKAIPVYSSVHNLREASSENTKVTQT